MVFVPGWIVSIKKSELIKYFIRLKYEQSIDSLSYYILKGEHNLNIPFGLYKKDNNTYGIILKKDEILNKKCFLIGSNVISILEIDNSDWETSEDIGIRIFLKNYIEYLITSNNADYTPSNLVKTYLGQYSKGRISKREKPIEVMESEFPYKVKFKLCEAEEFGVTKIAKDRYLISYVPRFEIFDDILQLPQNEYTHVFEEWQEKMARKVKNVYDRFNPINEIIKKAIRDQEIIIIDNENTPQFEDNKCSYPKFNLKAENIERLGLIRFSEIYFNEIMYRKTKNEKLRLIIILDLMSSQELDDKIHLFLLNIQRFFELEKFFIIVKSKKNSADISKSIQKLKNSLNCQIISISYTELNILNSYSRILFIINNNVPGFEFLYSEFKKIVKPTNKVLHIKTILEEDKEDLLFGLLYLSFLFREEKLNDLIIQNEIKPLISFYFQKDFEYQYTFLASSFIQLNGKFIVKKKLIPSIDYYEDNQDINNEIVAFLTENFQDIYNQFPDKNIVIFFKNSWDLKKYIDQSLDQIENKQNFSQAILQNIPIKLFNSDTSSDIPKNGTFVTFGLDCNKTIVLLTNGGVDKPMRGTPNPIVFNLLEDSQEKELEIITTIYFHSFYHPTSFSKPNLPIEYHLFNDLLYLPIQIKIQEDFSYFL